MTSTAPTDPSSSSSAGPTGSPTSTPPDGSSPGAVSVLDPSYGLSGDAGVDTDATPAFAAAMQAALAGTDRRPDGPSGEPQAVVYVPPGSYRLNGLAVPSDMRLEISAGAVLEPVAVTGPLSAADPIQLIQLGSHDATNQVSNVSVVGVGTAATDLASELKQRAAPTYGGWDITGYFTVDLDPTDSGASNDMAFATLINVRDFLISDLYVIQNGTVPTCTSADSGCTFYRGPYPMPTTARAAIVFKPSNQSAPPPGPYYDPTHGALTDMYTIHSPYGFGPTQITSGHDITVANLFSSGGTTLRIETDDSSQYHGGEVHTLQADHIVGNDCNRVVSLSAHKQANSDVHITDVTAIDCNNGLVQSADTAGTSGSFLDSTVDGLTIVGGRAGQVPTVSRGNTWTNGTSVKPVSVTPTALSWSAAVTGFSCSGPFVKKSNSFLLNGVKQVPRCPKTPAVTRSG